MRSVEVWTLSSGHGDGDYQSAVTLQSLLVSTVTKTTVRSDWMSERVWCEDALPRVTPCWLAAVELISSSMLADKPN